MILIDTSAWIDFFRDRAPAADRVDAALASNDAAWCGPIETELRRGFVNARERDQTLPLLAGCHFLPQPPDLWLEAGELGFALRRRGITPKTFDLLIAVYALSNAASLLSTDSNFKAMIKAGIPLQLVS